MGSTSDSILSFGDTASRGSQTETEGANGLELIGQISAPKTALSPSLGEKKRGWGHSPPLKSALVNSLSIPARNNKKRRTIPMSNWECNPAPPSPIPTEFDLGGFAFTYLPDPHQDWGRFNNDLVLDHYAPAARSYSGAQRKGIHEPFPDAASYMEHIHEALQAPFPLAEQPPLPADLLTALHFHRDNSRETIMEFQRSQLKQLRVIASECSDDTDRWYRFSPEELKSSSGKINIALLVHLARFTRMKGTNWLMQFVVGFPIIGELKQESVFPLSEAPVTELLGPETLFASRQARFRARAGKGSNRSAQELWDEAIQQVEKGWLDPLNRSTRTGPFGTDPTKGLI